LLEEVLKKRHDYDRRDHGLCFCPKAKASQYGGNGGCEDSA